MNSSSATKLTLAVAALLLTTACSSLELGHSDSPPEYTTQSTTTAQTSQTSIQEDLLIEFTDYTTTKNEDGTFDITITQEATEGCYYVLSMMYDGNVLEYVDGDGYLESHYGEFANLNGGDESTTSVEGDGTEEPTTTDASKSTVGKEGKWTLRSVSEGTEYVEIELIDQYGDVVYKSQYTCIVDTHLEPHIYYTNINY